MNDATRACAHARELMLVAEPAELRGTGSSLVAVHVRECMQCRVGANRMLNAQQELESALSELTGQSAAGRPRVLTELPASDSVLRPPSRRPSALSRSSAKSAGRAVAPLAVAAVLMLVLYQQRSDVELPRLEPLPDEIALAVRPPVVNVTSGNDVAIMTTTNPNITVIWYLKRER